MQFVEFWRKWKTKGVLSLRTKGVIGTFEAAVAMPKQVLGEQYARFHPCNAWNPWHRSLNERFDQQFAVDTAGIRIIPELHSDPASNVHTRFKGYAPTPRSIFRRMLRQVSIDYSKFVFVDLGCGKGKVLLLASELPFKQIIGIEVSPELIRVAEDNLQKYRGKRQCNSVQLLCMDVRQFRIPAEPAVYYLYDPFDAEVMWTTLENMAASLAAAPRESYLFYLTPEHGRVVDQCGFLKPVKRTPWYSIHKASEV
ncbi:MAG: class I SAM-dependent methyltransferase [Acidobacteria bacterium]|nr:class I SAM-dependent methyltransferase [Acidobacteriota bacterium]